MPTEGRGSSDGLRGRLDAASDAAARGDLRDRSAFLDALRAPSPGRRMEAASRLGEIGPLWAIDPIAALLGDRDADVRNVAIVALQNIGRPESVPHLIAALRDVEADRREDARAALVVLLGEDVPVSLDGDEDGTDAAEEPRRVARWWADASARFAPGTFLDSGEPVSIGDWIASLPSSPPGRRSWAASRLGWWTGQDFGPLDAPGFDEGWRRWWGENAGRFHVGRRYYHGFDVDAGSSPLPA